MDTIYNRDGCFYRALDDEPVFVLLARDPVAAETVRWWVTLRQALIGRGEKPLEDHDTLAAALRDAQSMVEWRADATGPQWLDGPRWKVEMPPERVLVSRTAYNAETAAHDATVREMQANIDRLEAEKIAPVVKGHGGRSLASTPGQPVGGNKLDYDDWMRVIGDPCTMRLGNRFLLWDKKGVGLVFHENRNYHAIDDRPDDWTGWYPLNHSLQHDMLLLAYTEFRKTALEQTATPSKTTGGHGIDAAKEMLWIDMAEERGFLSAEDAANQRSALPVGTVAAIPSKHLAFVAVDVGRKVAVGLRQVATDLTLLTEGREGGRVQLFLDIAYRIDGYATELDGVAADTDKRRVVASPLLGEPYGGRNLYDGVALDIQVRRLIEDYRRRFPEVARLWDGPDLGRGQHP